MPGLETRGPPRAQSAALIGLTAWQAGTVAGLVVVTALMLRLNPVLAAQAVHHFLWTAFAVGIALRWQAMSWRPHAPSAAKRAERRLPPYTVIAALRHEAVVVPQLIGRLSRLSYPQAKLRGYIVVEADDTETAAAVRKCPRPGWLKLIVAPPGAPMTKPRALNIALSRVTDGLVTVYDAEDDPDPDQLREAAGRFAAGGDRLACLQAPLRIRVDEGAGWLQRQFAGEYGALFEIVLPAMARLGLPFPLGGTRNHFRVEALRAVGGWDAFNVTEDADLGFRLWRNGYASGVLASPTWESPPASIRTWLRQRTRWLKGYLQTLGVHLRDPLGLGARGLAALFLTIGLTIAAALLEGVVLCWIAAILLVSAMQGMAPGLPPMDLVLLAAGWLTAAASCRLGARRAGVRYGWWEAFTSPLYWGLLTVALPHAVYRLVTQPFYWDKTPHVPDDEPSAGLAPVAALIRGPWLQGSPRPLRSSARAAGRTMASSTAATAGSSRGMARSA